jgi:hypothetical protein
MAFLGETFDVNELPQNTYSGVEEWAEFHTLEDAEQCQKRLMDMGYYFAGKLCAN